MNNSGNYLAVAAGAGVGSAEQWRSAVDAGDGARLRDACKEMEAVFLEILLREMFKTAVPVAGAGSELYQHLYIQELGRHVARSGGIGLADMMFRHLATTADHGGETVTNVESDQETDP